MNNGSTHFGYQRVTLTEKRKRVDQVFTNVASVYDTMNDVMSLGSHRVWKRQAIAALDCLSTHHVVDLACGTGDLSTQIIDLIPNGHLTCIDPNQYMLSHCQERLSPHTITYLLHTAETFTLENKADRLIIGFGLRNFTDHLIALYNIYENLNHGGKFVILEFNPPQATMIPELYKNYLHYLIPYLGKHIADDTSSYQYLSESICLQPTPDERIETLQTFGFENIRYTPLSLGIVGMFEAYRI